MRTAAAAAALAASRLASLLMWRCLVARPCQTATPGSGPTTALRSARTSPAPAAPGSMTATGRTARRSTATARTALEVCARLWPGRATTFVCLCPKHFLLPPISVGHSCDQVPFLAAAGTLQLNWRQTAPIKSALARLRLYRQLLVPQWQRTIVHAVYLGCELPAVLGPIGVSCCQHLPGWHRGSEQPDAFHRSSVSTLSRLAISAVCVSRCPVAWGMHYFSGGGRCRCRAAAVRLLRCCWCCRYLVPHY